MSSDSCRFREGSDGEAMGPPEIIAEHVPVPLQQPPGGFRGSGGFGRGALGSLPDDYPQSAARLTLKDIKACIQLCTDAEDISVLLRQTSLAPIICQLAAWHHQAWSWSRIKPSHVHDNDCLHVIVISAGIVKTL